MKTKTIFLLLFTFIFFSCKNSNSSINHKSDSEDFSKQITEKYWKLKILNEEKVKMEKQQEREVYLILKSDKNNVKGFSGCNKFSGFYQVKEKRNKIKFSNLSTNSKTCSDLKFNEATFLETLENVSQYDLKEDNLFLKDKENKILAYFKAVYF